MEVNRWSWISVASRFAQAEATAGPMREEKA
jgi:hypothetical protein